MNDENPYQPSTIRSPVIDPAWPTSRLFLLAVAIPITGLLTVHAVTGTLEKFSWMLLQTLPWMVLVWPVSTPVVIWASYAYRKASYDNRLGSRYLLTIVPLLLIPLMMLSWGTLFANSRGRGIVRWQLTVLHRSFYLSWAMSTVSIIVNKGCREFVAAVAILAVIFTFFCVFVAGQSLTGDWL